jgi:hypothetical protein
VAAQQVVAGAQVAAPERQRRVGLEEACVVDDALLLEDLADRLGVRPLGDLHGDAALLVVLAAERLEGRVDRVERGADEDHRQQRHEAPEPAARARGASGQRGPAGAADALRTGGAAHGRALGDRGATRR